MEFEIRFYYAFKFQKFFQKNRQLKILNFYKDLNPNTNSSLVLLDKKFLKKFSKF